MAPDLLVDFLQFNSVPLIENSIRMESLAGVLATSTTANSNTAQQHQYQRQSIAEHSTQGSWLDLDAPMTPQLLPMRDEMDQLEVSQFSLLPTYQNISTTQLCICTSIYDKATLCGFSDITLMAHR